MAEFGHLVAEKSGLGGSAEDQLRGPLENLLRRLGDMIGLQAVPYGEVALKDLRARPDFAVDVGRVRVGYIELKAPHKKLPLQPGWKPTARERKQWEKLTALPNLIYTNGLIWCRYTYGDPAGPVVRLEGSLHDRRKPLTVSGDDFTRLIEDFLLWVPKQPRSLPELIKVVAGLCDLLNEEVYSVLTGRPEHAAHEHLILLADDWRDLLFPGLDNRGFADAFAQTVTFAMLLARVDGISFDGASVQEIARLLTKKHVLMGRAFAVLVDGSAAEELRTIETLRRVIGAVDWVGLNDNQSDAYAELYERFLAVYDPHLRKTTGSYYTPTRLARFLVDFVDRLLRSHLDRPRGFSDDVITMDPAMGTGSFLVEVIRRVSAETDSLLGDGARRDYLQDLIDRRLIGFEIQVAPYAVAELRIHQALKHHFGIEVPARELRFLTDALADPKQRQERLGAPYRIIEQSREEANRIKREVPVIAMIGNPPHVENAKGRAPWIERRRGGAVGWQAFAERPSLDEFRSPGGGRYESDLHGMPWYFWRWAAWKVFEADPDTSAGVVAFITPSSFLTGKAFAGMREYLRRKCDYGWIIDLSPEGDRPPTPTRLFGPEVGRQLSVVVFVRCADAKAEQPADVRYLALEGTRDEKFARLTSVTPSDPSWLPCACRWEAPFLPVVNEEWEEMPALSDIMPWRSRGVTPGRTWVYAPTPEILRRRWQRFVSADREEQRTLFRESRDRTVDKVVGPLPGFPSMPRPLSREHGSCPEPVQVSYRSFDRQWLIPDNRLLVMARPPLWQVRSEHQIYVCQQDAHHVQSGPAVVFTGLVPDLHHFNGRAGGVHPLWRDGRGSEPNIAPGFLSELGRRLGRDISAADLLAYVAAVIAHPGYTRRFQDELRIPGVRVPLSADPRLWRKSFDIGDELVWLHTYGSRRLSRWKEERGDFGVVKKYGVRCLAPVIDLPEQLPDSLEYDELTSTLRIGGGEFGPVAPEVLNADVGGRRIVWHWLNERMILPRSKRRTSALDEIRVTCWNRRFTDEFLALLSVLTGCLRLEPLQRELLQEICSGPLISLSELHDSGVLQVTDVQRKGPRREPEAGGVLFAV
ncbi:type ISP restriction/modification enzyme [Actinomadura sp. NPDC047616]|uniref:type ISP restriction/modification enzyme n=1 Tax=Actinomadura sp. NPDC047616 TaxID=3155914 RepID=UPI0033C43B82